MNNYDKELYEVVEKINDELYEKYSNNLENMPVVSITFLGYCTYINLIIPSVNWVMPEFLLYDSENEDRIFYEKSGKYETYYKYIKRKFLKIKKEINNIKL